MITIKKTNELIGFIQWIVTLVQGGQERLAEGYLWHVSL